MWERFQKCNVWHNSFIIIFRLDHDIQYRGANFAFLGPTHRFLRSYGVTLGFLFVNT